MVLINPEELAHKVILLCRITNPRAGVSAVALLHSDAFGKPRYTIRMTAETTNMPFGVDIIYTPIARILPAPVRGLKPEAADPKSMSIIEVKSSRFYDGDPILLPINAHEQNKKLLNTRRIKKRWRRPRV
jgi:hypothetical protein